MTNLLWPGDARAGSVFDDAAVLSAMVSVEAAWLAALVDAGIAPASAASDLDDVVTADDLPELARAAEHVGNPAAPVVSLLRERMGDTEPDVARWLHRGLTSQDVLDTALVLCGRDALDAIEGELARQVERLAGLVDRYRATAMVGRTLTQPAVPVTFGLKAATWLTGVLDAADEVRRVRADLPAQFGGAAGTLAATVHLARGRAGVDPVVAARAVAHAAATALGLRSGPPWHTSRAPLVRMATAFTACTAAWGHVADDVLLLSRPELGELREGTGGGSSTMPQKANPVLSVLLRRAALAAPPDLAHLQLAAATVVDERPDGAWHLEWDALRRLARHTVAAGAQSTDLLTGLVVDADRMLANLQRAPGVYAERDAMSELVAAAGPDDDAYLGAADALVDDVLARARERGTT